MFSIKSINTKVKKHDHGNYTIMYISYNGLAMGFYVRISNQHLYLHRKKRVYI